MVSFAEYIWLDGAKPTHELRSKTRVVSHERISFDPKDYPTWTFDGSSTGQASGSFSDLLINPVRVVKDPIRGNNNVLVLCEVLNADHSPHSTNSRSRLRQVLENGAAEEEPLFGFEQEYTLFQGVNPIGWPMEGLPKPQGPYYCGVGTDKIFGRDIVEKHLQYCIDAGLSIYGINAEVMPGQWEYQVGYRGFKNDELDGLTICDHQMFARWLLCRTAEAFNVTVSFDNKPIKGDWNGSGCHTNFSTKAMRNPKTGYDNILNIIDRLAKKHEQHVKFYGYNLHERLTGLHETCSIHQFRYGVSDRGASVRIPINVKEEGCGYLEDRRPGANSDPYLVAACILTTACNLTWDWAAGSSIEQTQTIKI
ncbi:MAG: glutamine synthetase beta-grasp domain-containing protein [Gammaproteobacteria bacterium]|nr:glutamine synthetase beta-grasp domain-containing protein [Gammaproteobacteria bacterium]